MGLVEVCGVIGGGRGYWKWAWSVNMDVVSGGWVWLVNMGVVSECGRG